MLSGWEGDHRPGGKKWQTTTGFMTMSPAGSAPDHTFIIPKGLYHDGQNHDGHKVYRDGHSNGNVKN